MADIDNSNDYLDVRDIIARVEELREIEQRDECESEELATLEALLYELRGNDGDEQWEGDWYPVTLIRDTYFEEAMDDLISDCYELPKDFPSFVTLSIDYEALRMDYTSVDYDGVTYWYR